MSGEDRIGIRRAYDEFPSGFGTIVALPGGALFGRALLVTAWGIYMTSMGARHFLL